LDARASPAAKRGVCPNCGGDAIILIEVPMTPATDETTPVRERVQSVINLIRPAVQADGGDIELVDVSEQGVVQIRFHGACHGCPSSHMTLQDGIERNLRERVPEVKQVVPVP
jgi:Fe-S cluster biogenesis protein NfuA